MQNLHTVMQKLHYVGACMHCSISFFDSVALKRWVALMLGSVEMLERTLLN
jgi:hypothetical protein